VATLKGKAVVEMEGNKYEKLRTDARF